ncbi:hypothetical protein [Mesorhizobium sp.]|uniref:hypothetical protein n=1 Tax=Mesorhizobium sp. TaxID=1871066 RepID=UPI000FE579F5|nr:hypothetical protein [Mesorhizobium sp.]RWE99022.1 MAG: hypothetical protein EOS68_12720 [Mesorhizobium sp.]
MGRVSFFERGESLACGFGGVFNIRFSVSLKLFSSVSFSGLAMIKDLPEDRRNTFAAIGLLTVCWASAEYAMDFVIRYVHERYEGNQVAPVPPISFKGKPPYLKKVFANHPDLAEHLPQLTELLEEAWQIAEQRHWCIHGSIDLRADATSFPISKIIHGKEHRQDTRKFTVKQIEKLAGRASALSLNLFFFGVQTVGIMPKDEADKLVRELLRKYSAALPEGNLFS